MYNLIPFSLITMSAHSLPRSPVTSRRLQVILFHAITDLFAWNKTESTRENRICWKVNFAFRWKRKNLRLSRSFKIYKASRWRCKKLRIFVCREALSSRNCEKITQVSGNSRNPKPSLKKHRMITRHLSTSTPSFATTLRTKWPQPVK